MAPALPQAADNRGGQPFRTRCASGEAVVLWFSSLKKPGRRGAGGAGGGEGGAGDSVPPRGTPRARLPGLGTPAARLRGSGSWSEAAPPAPPPAPLRLTVFTKLEPPDLP